MLQRMYTPSTSLQNRLQSCVEEHPWFVRTRSCGAHEHEKQQTQYLAERAPRLKPMYPSAGRESSPSSFRSWGPRYLSVSPVIASSPAGTKARLESELHVGQMFVRLLSHNALPCSPIRNQSRHPHFP